MLEQIVAPENIFVNWFCTQLVQLTYCALLQWIVPPRSRKLYWGVLLPPTLLFPVLRPFVMGGFVQMLYGLVDTVILPFLLLKGRAVKRILTIACLYMILFAGELAASFVWVFATGEVTLDNAAAYRHAPLFLFITVLDCGFQIALAMPLKRLLDRIFPIPEPEEASAGGSSRLLACAIIPVLQMALLLFLMYISNILLQGDLVYAGFVALAVAGCIFIDVILFYAVARYWDAERDEQRSRMVLHQVEEYLVEAEAVQVRLGALARFRHDLRNNVGVVQHLCEAGCMEEAGEYLRALRCKAGEL